MLNMCPDAWYIFIRTIQLCAFLLLVSFVMLIQCGGSMSGGYELYMTAISLNEITQSLLLIAIVASVCIEDVHR